MCRSCLWISFARARLHSCARKTHRISITSTRRFNFCAVRTGEEGAIERRPMHLVNRKSEIVNGEWLPDMDLNHDKQIQSLLCYRYTIGQTGALEKLKGLMSQSSRQTSAGLQEERNVDACPGHAVPKGQATIAQRFNAGLEANRSGVPKGRPRARPSQNSPTVT